MTAEIIPLLVVKDVAANIDYLTKTLGFEFVRAEDGGQFAVMKYHGARLMLQSRQLYAFSRKVSFDEVTVGQGVEILIKINGVDEVFQTVREKGANITRPIHSVAETEHTAIRRFSAALSDGYVITFFEYCSAEI